MVKIHELYKDDIFGSLTINEIKNKFIIEFDSNHLYSLYPSEEMPPEELAKVFIRGLDICSKAMKSNKIEELILDYIKENKKCIIS